MSLLLILSGLIVVALSLFLFIFWLLMLIDCLKRNFSNSNEKVLWVLLIIFLHLLGASLYWLIVKNKKG